MAKAELSVLLDDLRGKAGNVVFCGSRDGVVVKKRSIPKNPRTPAQMAARENLRKATQIFRSYTPTQVQGWKNYAGGINHHNPVNGVAYTPTAINAFVTLATKLLQVNPTGTIPSMPPTTAFAGDTVTISVVASAGTLTFSASKANAANVTTEILLQPLPSANRKPSLQGMRHKAFQAFASGSLSLPITVPPGYYAAAYRFVNTLTGQTTLPVMLAVNQVTLALEEGGNKSARKVA
ncbi:MAG: hypothetical protein ABL949_04210 [Fimbriimonadaceae bacterium]